MIDNEYIIYQFCHDTRVSVWSDISVSRNRTEFYNHSNCSAKGQVNALKASYIQFYDSFP